MSVLALFCDVDNFCSNFLPSGSKRCVPAGSAPAVAQANSPCVT